MKHIITIGFLLLLIACGGGGGSDSSPPTTPTTPTTPVTPTPPPTPPVTPPVNTDLLAKYTGIRSIARIDVTNSHDISHHIIRLHDLTNLLIYNNDFRQVRFDYLVAQYADLSTLNGECETGEFVSTEPTAQNRIDFAYQACQIGPYTINGNGFLLALNFDNNGELNLAEISFDNVEISYEKQSGNRSTYNIEGVSRVDIGPVVISKASFDALITEQETQTQYYLNKLEIGLNIVNSDPNGYGMAGEVYLSDYGIVQVSTISEYSNAVTPAQSMALAVTADKTLIINNLGGQNIGLGLFQSTAEVSQTSRTIDFNFIDQKQYLNTPNNAPTASYLISNTRINKRETLLLDASNSGDSDFDLLNYNWEIIEQPQGANLQISNNGFVNASVVFDLAGDYRFQLRVDDGELSDQSAILQLYVRKDPPVVSLVSSPTEIAFGQSFQSQINIENPQDDGPFEVSIHSGPLSMSIGDNNLLFWDGRLPRLQKERNVTYSVKVANADHEVIVKQSVLHNDTSVSPLTQITEYEPTVLLTFDYLNDQSTDLLVSKGKSVEIIELGTQNVLWTGTLPESEIRYIKYEPINNGLFFYTAGLDQLFRLDLSTQQLNLLADLSISPFRISGVFEIWQENSTSDTIIISTTGYYNTNTQAFVRFQFNVSQVDDVDGDLVPELISRDGIYRFTDLSLLYDTSNIPFELQQTVFADVDGDGISEMFNTNARIFAGQEPAYYLEIYTLQNNQFILQQRFDEQQTPVSFGLSADSQELYLIEGEQNIRRYVYSPTNSQFQAQDLRALNNFDYETFTQFDDKYAPCSIQSIRSATVLLRCDGRLITTGTFKSSFDIVDLGANELVLNTIVDSTNKNESFGKILNQDDQIIVGQRNGISIFDEQRNRQKVELVNSSSDRLFFQNFYDFTFDDEQAFGWDALFDRVQRTNLTSAQVDDYEYPGANIPNLLFFELAQERFTFLQSSQYLVMLNRDTMQEISRFNVNEQVFAAEFFNDTNALVSYTIDDQALLTVWINNTLLTFEYKQSQFSLIDLSPLPSESFVSGEQMMSVVEQNGQTTLVLLNNSRVTENDSVSEFNNFEHLVFNVSDKSFVRSQTFTERFGTNDPLFFDYCVASNQTKTRHVAYIFGTNFAVEQEFQDESSIIAGKIGAFDLASGELVWSSNSFTINKPADGGQFRIACKQQGDSITLTFSSGKELYFGQ
ncbi:hypothetical protein [Glaciecola sp. SC05]|uniref:PKD domain-containing protein n=1 Tax=Glaciecola sp. SC05 TaxID=1987355 RepID=UPI0035272E59